MIEDSIKAVKEAELKANTMLADARKQADDIIMKAKDEAALRVKKADENCKAQAAEEMDRARTAGESVLEEARKDAASEVKTLKEATNGKISEAVSAVIRELI